MMNRRSDEKSRRVRFELAACTLAGLFGAPGAWLLQVMLAETISAQSCYGVSAPRRLPALMHLMAWLDGISVSALAVAAVCAAVAAWGFIQVSRMKRLLSSDSSVETIHGMDASEISRKRFLALCSTLVGGGFVLGLLFTLSVEFFLHGCSEWH